MEALHVFSLMILGLLKTGTDIAWLIPWHRTDEICFRDSNLDVKSMDGFFLPCCDSFRLQMGLSDLAPCLNSLRMVYIVVHFMAELSL
jgi:hypothetical protein